MAERQLYASALVRSTTSHSVETALPVRHLVAAVADELLSGNFTRPSDELTEVVRALAPQFTPREGEILLTATAAAARHVAGIALTLDSLRREGRTSAAAERDLARRLGYLHLGPIWPRFVPESTAPSAPPSVQSTGTETVELWLHGQEHNLQRVDAAPTVSGLVVNQGVECMELDKPPSLTPSVSTAGAVPTMPLSAVSVPDVQSHGGSGEQPRLLSVASSRRPSPDRSESHRPPSRDHRESSRHYNVGVRHKSSRDGRDNPHRHK